MALDPKPKVVVLQPMKQNSPNLLYVKAEPLAFELESQLHEPQAPLELKHPRRNHCSKNSKAPKPVATNPKPLSPKCQGDVVDREKPATPRVPKVLQFPGNTAPYTPNPKQY